ncbi:MAG: hypothetical protein R3C18_01635 [Planctomycetaceae bacterium]
MTVALDLGSSEFRSLRNTEKQLLARRIEAIYTVVPDSVQQRQQLNAADISFLASSNQLVIPGSSARAVSELQRTPIVPVIDGGGIPVDDPIGRQVLAGLITSLLPNVANNGKLTPCYATLPTETTTQSPTGDFISRVLRLQGYQLHVVQSAHALAISQLAKSGYTGLVFDFGATTVACCLTHSGLPVWDHAFPVGVRDIELEFAEETNQKLWDGDGNQYLDTSKVVKWLQSGQVTLHRPATSDQKLFVTLFHKMLRPLLKHVSRILADKEMACYLPVGIPILAGGRCTSIPGFAHMFYDALVECELPVRNAEIQLARPDAHAVARGALIMGLLDTDGDLSVLEELRVHAA